jgi:hypothetical protein
MPTEYIANHEPLRLREINDFSEEAAVEARKPLPNPDRYKISTIQVRLQYGMIGSTMPYKTEGNINVARSILSNLYMEFIHGSGLSVDDLAVQLYELMKTK